MKEKLINNKFIEILRLNMQIDENEYSSLTNTLVCLKKECKQLKYIDKELVSYLYEISNVIRNILCTPNGFLNDDEFFYRLEEIWIETDQLIADIFY